MTALLPPGFLFRWEFGVRDVPGLPGTGKTLLKFPETSHIAVPGGLIRSVPFALRLAWNSKGLGISVEVQGKKFPAVCDPDRPLETDAVLVWIDTRNVQDVHRATRFCHLFALLPRGGGARGDEPAVRQLPVPRAGADAPTIDVDDVLLEANGLPDGYRVSAWFPAAVLNGFDPASQSKLGFFCELRDSELGRHPLNLDADFPYDGDPSLWCSLALEGSK